MNRTEALDEYGRALRLGQKEYKELLSTKRDPYPAVLDDILFGRLRDQVVDEL